MEQQHRAWPFWIGGIVAALSAVLLVLAFVPLVKCPDRRSLDEEPKQHQEARLPAAHRPDCALCAGRGRTSVLQWIRICKACGGTGWELNGNGGWIPNPAMRCMWCNGTGKNPFQVR